MIVDIPTQYRLPHEDVEEDESPKRNPSVLKERDFSYEPPSWAGKIIITDFRLVLTN